MPDLLLVDFETTGVDTSVLEPLQCAAMLLRWDNKDLTILARDNDYYKAEEPRREWGAFDFHCDTGFLREYEIREKEGRLSDPKGEGGVDDMLCDLLKLSISQSRPMLCARNVAFERGIMERYAPNALKGLHSYRNIDMTALSLHPHLNSLHKVLISGSSTHFADVDVEIEYEILHEFLEVLQ